MASPRLNKGRHSKVGNIYSITTVTYGRRPLFAHPDLAKIVRMEIEEADKADMSASIAWVLMPDHLHWLFQLRAGTLSKLVQKLKMRTAQSMNEAQHCRGSVWQAGFHDHCVRDETSLRNLARYLLENPVRAGLSIQAGDYPHCWWAWGSKDEAPW